MQRLVRALEWVVDAVNLVVAVVMGLAIALIFVLLAGQVVLRYLVFAPFNWVEEGATYLMAVLTLLGMALLLRRNVHLRVELLPEIIEARFGRVLSGALQIAALLATATLGWYLTRAGWAYAWTGRNEVSPSGAFIEFWPRLAIPLGAGLLTVQALVMALRVALPEKGAGKPTVQDTGSSS